MESKFGIASIRLVEAHFALNQKFKWEKDKPIELQHSIDIACENREEMLNVIVTVSSDSNDQPFRFTVSWEGKFKFEVAPAKDMIERIAHVNCASIIFPYVRESIADLTRRANIMPLNMPPINFVALYEQKQGKAKQAVSKKLRKKVEHK
ncbi:MAG: protein-export chaperone SecB [Deltaproteobacteria bacterium]|nr:protein-export chaperone SecB [Deltaproteobacteria bacterium]